MPYRRDPICTHYTLGRCRDGQCTSVGKYQGKGSAGTGAWRGFRHSWRWAQERPGVGEVGEVDVLWKMRSFDSGAPRGPVGASERRTQFSRRWRQAVDRNAAPSRTRTQPTQRVGAGGCIGW